MAFVRDVGDLLEAIVEARLVGDNVAGLHAEAWPAIRGRFPAVIRQLEIGDIERELVERGLTGPELRFKIGVANLGLDRVRQGATFVIERLRAVPAYVVGSILEAVDAVLESLVFILGVEAMVEFKEPICSTAGSSL